MITIRASLHAAEESGKDRAYAIACAYSMVDGGLYPENPNLWCLVS